jgi:hypothetical protein
MFIWIGGEFIQYVEEMCLIFNAHLLHLVCYNCMKKENYTTWEFCEKSDLLNILQLLIYKILWLLLLLQGFF